MEVVFAGVGGMVRALADTTEGAADWSVPLSGDEATV